MCVATTLPLTSMKVTVAGRPLNSGWLPNVTLTYGASAHADRRDRRDRQGADDGVVVVVEPGCVVVVSPAASVVVVVVVVVGGWSS